MALLHVTSRRGSSLVGGEYTHTGRRRYIVSRGAIWLRLDNADHETVRPQNITLTVVALSKRAELKAMGLGFVVSNEVYKVSVLDLFRQLPIAVSFLDTRRLLLPCVFSTTLSRPGESGRD